RGGLSEAGTRADVMREECQTTLRVISKRGGLSEAGTRADVMREECQTTLRVMSRRDILSVTPHKAAGRSVGYEKCGISLRSANVMCTEGPDKPAAK
ncbi:MAG: hypothetical protein IKO62_03695, partial [Bacteroidales bacterium]|nr:hypothetical protein [Bacteroidales bacterium]